MKIIAASFRPFVPVVAFIALVATAAGPAQAKIVRTVEKSFPVQSGGTLKIVSQGGDIAIQTGEGAEVIVVARQNIRASTEAEADELLKRLTLTFEQQGNVVTVTSKYEAKLPGLHFGSWPPVLVDFVVTVPHDFNADLKTSGGDIAVGNLNGRVLARTSGGDVKLEKIDGTVDAGTSGGDIMLREGTAAVKLSTSGGDIQIERATGPIEVSTSGGDIAISSADNLQRAATSGGDITAMLTAAPKEDCSLHTSGGDVTVHLPKAAAFNLDAGTSGGKVDAAGLTITIEKGGVGRSRLSGKVNGGGAVLSLRSSGGDIEIRTD
ncbi:MAG: DUF4097 family beta strand repeat-containing protein [Opitutaceae bacterium]|nr:DUF4097 family beta strand repeat-containing protein [Opitutaceae bacterium]